MWARNYSRIDQTHYIHARCANLQWHAGAPGLYLSLSLPKNSKTKYETHFSRRIHCAHRGRPPPNRTRECVIYNYTACSVLRKHIRALGHRNNILLCLCVYRYLHDSKSPRAPDFTGLPLEIFKWSFGFLHLFLPVARSESSDSKWCNGSRSLCVDVCVRDAIDEGKRNARGRSTYAYWNGSKIDFFFVKNDNSNFTLDVGIKRCISIWMHFFLLWVVVSMILFDYTLLCIIICNIETLVFSSTQKVFSKWRNL